jgi:hypothetical protein
MIFFILIRDMNLYKNASGSLSYRQIVYSHIPGRRGDSNFFGLRCFCQMIFFILIRDMNSYKNASGKEVLLSNFSVYPKPAPTPKFELYRLLCIIAFAFDGVLANAEEVIKCN